MKYTSLGHSVFLCVHLECMRTIWRVNNFKKSTLWKLLAIIACYNLGPIQIFDCHENTWKNNWGSSTQYAKSFIISMEIWPKFTFWVVMFTTKLRATHNHHCMEILQPSARNRNLKERISFGSSNTICTFPYELAINDISCLLLGSLIVEILWR